MNFKNIELSFQSVLDYYINQQQISCRIIKNESAWDREKQDILERANWLSDKIIVEPEILLKKCLLFLVLIMADNGQFALVQCFLQRWKISVSSILKQRNNVLKELINW